jgi:TP901 family phage tail tape measure protein
MFGEFLINIKEALDKAGHAEVIGGVKQTQQAIQQLAKTKITTTFDKEGVATGKQVEETFKNINAIVPKSQTIMGDFGNVMRKALIVAPVWILLRGAIMGVMQTLQALPASAIAWEKEMAQIQRVGKGTGAEYAILSTRLLDLAKTYGVTTASMGQGAALWAQQGKSLSEIVPLMETTIKLSLITGKTVSESVEDITAIMKSYKIEANETSSILDKLIKVEQEHAITTDVLTDAMKKAAPVAAQFDISFEKLLGIITATHVATRASGGEIGNAWKTIFARMATSAIPAIQNIAKVPVYMDKLGNSTYQNTGTFRDWGNVLDEVMVSMGSLNETQQIALTSALAMKRTLNYLLAAYQSWDEGVKATVESLNSFGVADKSLNILLGTTASKAEQLKSSWSEFGVTLINNGQIIKDSIDLLKAMVSGLNDMVLLSHGLAGQELFASKVAQEGLDKEIQYRSQQLSQLKSIVELQKLLGEAKEFEVRIKENTSFTADQKDKILSVIHQRQQFIQETIDKQPKIEVGELFLESTIRRGEELQKVRDAITALAVEASNVAPNISTKLLSEAPIQELENRLKFLKEIPEETLKTTYAGREEEFKNTIKYLTEIIKLRKDEVKISSVDYLGNIEERLKNEKEFAKTAKEFQEDDAKLTIQQEAQLKLERELSTFGIQRGITEEQLLQKKIELVKVSEQFNSEQERTLALAKLENQLIDARLQKRKQEEDRLLSISMQYEKADMFEKGRIRQAAELTLRKPEELTNLGTEEQQIAMDNFSSFSKEQQDIIAQNTTLYKELGDQLESNIALEREKQAQIGNEWAAIRGNQLPTNLGGEEAIPPIPAAPNVLNNTYNIPITLTGAITDDDIQALLDKIEATMKDQPNYIGDKDLISQIENNPQLKKKIADVAGNTNTR